MGLRDTIFGRTKPVAANLDALFGLPSAAITLETAAGLTLSGHAGVCWKPPAGQATEEVQQEIEALLDLGDGDDTTTGASPTSGAPTPPLGQLTQKVDAYGYRWLLLEDPEADALVTRVHMVNSTLSDNGWGPQLLCSVFGVVPQADAGPDAKPFYLVYLFKRGTFYPFAPSGHEQRDNEVELRARAVLANDLKIEEDLARWFPLWDLPVR